MGRRSTCCVCRLCQRVVACGAWCVVRGDWCGREGGGGKWEEEKRRSKVDAMVWERKHEWAVAC